MAATIEEILDDLLDNADFEEQESVSKAKKFVTQAKRFLILAPAQASDQGSTYALSVDQIYEMLRRAQSYVETNSTQSTTSTRVRFLSAKDGFLR